MFFLRRGRKGEEEGRKIFEESQTKKIVFEER